MINQLPPACIPEHHRAAAIFAFRYRSLETSVGVRSPRAALVEAVVDPDEAPLKPEELKS
jgi:hypothetical protein